MVYEGRTLDEGCTLAGAGVALFGTLELLPRLRGGGGDGGSTGAESRSCYLEMYAGKKADKVGARGRMGVLPEVCVPTHGGSECLRGDPVRQGIEACTRAGWLVYSERCVGVWLTLTLTQQRPPPSPAPPRQVNPEEERLAKWTMCQLTGQPLTPPCVVDELGNLFNKDAVIQVGHSENGDGSS